MVPVHQGQRNLVVRVPSIRQPIMPAPGFAKKELAEFKLDLMALCGFGCAYCSSNDGNYLRVNRERFADLTEEQLGYRLYPSSTPRLNMVWGDVLQKLDTQLRNHPATWGAGKVLVFSMLTDAFSGPTLRSGITQRALEMVFARTAFRVRILTKNSIVGLSQHWLRLLAAHRDRVVVGLSIGTLDDAWARRVEIDCPLPSARVRALRALQDASVPTFGMLCPVFPDVLAGDGIERLVEPIRPERCEHIWAEPYNDRSNWQAVRAGYAEGSPGWNWLTEAFEGDDRTAWSRYATELFLRLHDLAAAGGWLSKLRYLLYERDVSAADAERFAEFDGVLLQDKPDKETGHSRHPVFARYQPQEAGLEPMGVASIPKGADWNSRK